MPTSKTKADARRRRPKLPADVGDLTWVCEQWGISATTAYRLALAGEIPGLFRAGNQYRVSKVRFLAAIHGDAV